MHNEQDIRNMGGLRKKMPVTYYTFLISTLALSGIPLTSGFLSKDGILAGTLAFGKLTGHWLIPVIGFSVAFMTAFYMFRLVILTFHGKPRDTHKYDHAHESPFVMTAPLVVLSLLSIFIWYTPNPLAPADGWFLKNWIKAPAQVTPVATRFDFMKPSGEEIKSEFHGEITHSVEYTEAMHWAHNPAMFISLGAAGIGILLAFLFYQWKKLDPDKLASAIKPVYNFSLNKWYLDEAYDKTAVAGTLGVSSISAWFDQYIVDGAVNGSAWLTRWVSRLSGLFDTYVVDGLVNLTAFVSGFIGLSFRKLQTGKVQTYIVIVVFAVVILLLIFKPF
jgi:NADH-quinone oxidoreductase subunit L